MNYLKEAQELKKLFDFNKYNQNRIKATENIIRLTNELLAKAEKGCGENWRMWNPETEEYMEYGKCRIYILCPECETIIKICKGILK